MELFSQPYFPTRSFSDVIYGDRIGASVRETLMQPKIVGGEVKIGSDTSSLEISPQGLFLGAATFNAAPFRVSLSGALVATSATISGSITATAGVIGGWSIGSSDISSGSGSSHVALDSGGTNPAIYAGSETPASAPFRVSGTGQVTATSGTIGGWSMGTSTLSSGSDESTSGISLDASESTIRVGSSSGHHIDIDGANEVIRSSNFTSGSFGAGFSLDSLKLEVGDLKARGTFSSMVFETGSVTAVGGSVFLTKGADVLVAGSGATFGNTSIGGTNASTTNYIGCKFTPVSSGTLTSIVVYTKAAASTVNVDVAVYSDVAGQPTTKLASGTSLTSVDTGAQWVNVPISLAITSGTTYWLFFWASGSHSVYYDSGSANQYYVNGGTFNSWPTTETGGTFFSRNVSIYANYTVTATDSVSMSSLDSSTLTISGKTFPAVNDILRIKDASNDEWLLVTDISSAPTYRVTRDLASSYAANANPSWTAGQSVVNYGPSGSGAVLWTATDSPAPRIDILTHAGSPWSTTTTQVRIGNLNGFLDYSSNLYGIAIGSSSAYLKYDSTNGLRLKSTKSQINVGVAGYVAGSKTSYNDTTEGFFLGEDSGEHKMNIGNSTEYLKWTGSSLIVIGGIDASSPIALATYTASTIPVPSVDTGFNAPTATS